MALAAFLFALPDGFPVFLSSYLPNLLVATGIAAMRGSIRQFAGLGRNDLPIVLLLAVVALTLFQVTFINDDYRGRIVVMSGALAMLFGACAHEVVRLAQAGAAQRFTAFVFGATAGIMLVRFVTVIYHGAGLTRDATDTSPIHQLYMATFSFSLVALSVGFLLMVNDKLQRKLELLAIRDKQTGVYQQDAFIALLEKEMAESRTRHQPMAVLMIDLDNSSNINGSLGQQAVDLVMRDLAEKTRDVLRRHDAVGRYGEDGLLVMAPGATAPGARAIAERILRAAGEKRRADVPPYTANVGIAMLGSEHEEAGAIIDAANRALHAARHAGSGRIEIAAQVRERGL